MISRSAAIFASAAVISGAAMAEVTVPEAKTRLLMSDFARCSANRLSAKFYPLLLDANTRLEVQARSVLAGGVCYEVTPGDPYLPRFTGDSYRYLMADAMVRKEFLDYAVSDFSAVAPLKHFIPDPVGTKLPRRVKPDPKMDQLRFGVETTMRAISVFGECVVRAAPTLSLALLATPVETDREETAFANLQSSYGPCIVGENSLAFSRSVLRGTIAFNYYRLASAHKAQSMSKVLH